MVLLKFDIHQAVDRLPVYFINEGCVRSSVSPSVEHKLVLDPSNHEVQCVINPCPLFPNDLVDPILLASRYLNGGEGVLFTARTGLS